MKSEDTNDLGNLLQQYLDTLTTKETLSYEIAKQQLGSSFQLEKSSGFLRWLATISSRSTSTEAK
jgi:hypothetical protein